MREGGREREGERERKREKEEHGQTDSAPKQDIYKNRKHCDFDFRFFSKTAKIRNPRTFTKLISAFCEMER